MAEKRPTEAGFSDSFEAAFARLQVRLERACLGEDPSDWPAQVAAAVREALAFAAADPVAARTLTTDALAQGRDGFARYDRMIEYFGRRLLPGRAVNSDIEGEELPEITEKAMTGGLAMLISNRVDQGRESELESLAPEAIRFVLTAYVGAAEARRAAADTG
jgi:hypothetical protein